MNIYGINLTPFGVFLMVLMLLSIPLLSFFVGFYWKRLNKTLKGLLYIIIAVIAIVIVGMFNNFAQEISRDAAMIQQQEDITTAKIKQQRDNVTSNLKVYQEQLKEMVAELNVAESQLNDIKGFQWLRTSEEKNQQIRQQTLKIENIQDNIKILQSNIDKSNAYLGR